MAARYAAVVATGRSDLPNQINNVLAFPGIFRGAIDAGAHEHHRGDEAGRGRPRSPTSSATTCGPDYVVPSPLDRRVAAAVAEAVAACAREQGVTV